MTITFDNVAPVVPVRDLDAALERYRRLGFRAKPYEGPDRYGYVDRDSVSFHLTEWDEHDPERTGASIYLYVSDADELHAAWKIAGVEGRLTKPHDTPYGLREFAYVDPEGTLHRVGSPSKGADQWDRTGARIAFIQIDCHDPERLAMFWTGLLGTKVEERVGQYVCVAAQNPGAPSLCFQAVLEDKVTKNRVHIDIAVTDIEQAVRQVALLGGTQISTGDVEEYGWRYRVMADPEGNEFCLTW